MQTRQVQTEFLNALLGEDDLGVVVRTHIHIESSVNVLLDLLIPFPGELPNLRYQQKLKLCCALGMDKTLFPPLKELGDLRNSFAHNIEAKLTTASVAKLFKQIAPDDLLEIARSYFTTRVAVAPDLPKLFAELDPKGKLIGLALWLNVTLDVLHEDARLRLNA
jgi:hypothetical protein